MSSRRAWNALVTLLLTTILSIPSHSADGAGKWYPVPKASCGSRDRLESGLQGQTTLAERFRPGAAQSYNCNLELIGQFEGEGSSFGMNTFGNCAYYSTWENPKMRHPGVVVLDVSDSRHPKATAYLNSPAMLSANESLEFASTRNLLLASRFPPMTGAPFDIYDLSQDCRHPVLISTTEIPRMQSHAGQFSPDGLTFYAAASGATSDPAAPASALFVIDVSNPARPRGVATWIPPHKGWGTHGVKLNKAGTRAYVALNPTGLVILDISDFQARRPNPKFHLVSTLFWDDTYIARWPQPVTIKGRPYLIWREGAGTVPITGVRNADACRSGKPGHGFARIIDIANEKEPKTVSSLMLEVADPANCMKVVYDPTILGYGPEGCDVDNESDTKLLACGHYEAGLRVFDIRDPKHPREMAYYKPPARRDEVRPGSPFSQTGPQLFPTAAPKDHTADVVAFVKFRENGQELWFNSFDNGFQVVRFTDRFKAAHPDLFNH